MCLCACLHVTLVFVHVYVCLHGFSSDAELPKGDSHEARACLTGLASQHLHGSFPLSAW